MFTGSLPKPVVEQVLRLVSFNEWSDVFVCCSGSFRVDRAIKARFPEIRVHSNDVSLLSCALGALATGGEFAIRFKGRLEFLEEHLVQATFARRVAAVLVASDVAPYKGFNPWAVSHFDHYRVEAGGYLDRAGERLDKFLKGLDVADFTAGDFRDHARRAAAGTGGVFAFPPTYKGGYERLYRFLNENVDWPAPAYAVWNPDDLEAWIGELRSAKTPYCVVGDQVVDRFRPVAVYRPRTGRPVYTYTGERRSSVRQAKRAIAPFRNEPIDPMALGPQARIEIVRLKPAQMDYLRSRYLGKGIKPAAMHHPFAVLIDGHLAGAFGFQRDSSGDPERLYLMTDFAVSRERRLSKLVAMLATSRDVIRPIEVRMATRIRRVRTTAFTDRAVSMKYRGIFHLESRKPGMLNYVSDVREEPVDTVYRTWFEKYAGNADPAGEAD